MILLLGGRRNQVVSLIITLLFSITFRMNGNRTIIFIDGNEYYGSLGYRSAGLKSVFHPFGHNFYGNRNRCISYGYDGSIKTDDVSHKYGRYKPDFFHGHG